MIFTYFIQALDKGTLSFSSIMGIQKDAHLHGSQYAWLTTGIYIAILIVEYPTNWLLARLPVAKYLGISIILWGTVLMLHSVAKSFTHLIILRILLGVFECVCQPAFVLLSSMWCKQHPPVPNFMLSKELEVHGFVSRAATLELQEVALGAATPC